MEANPYYRKEIDGGFYNKYPEFQIWEDGKRAGIKEVVEWIKANNKREGSPPYCFSAVWFDYDKWQAFLKEWGVENGKD